MIVVAFQEIKSRYVSVHGCFGTIEFKDVSQHLLGTICP